jgi:hypothetical protein
MQKAAKYFNVDYRSILNHLNTKLATKPKGADKLVLFFSNELTNLEKQDLLKNKQEVLKEITAI